MAKAGIVVLATLAALLSAVPGSARVQKQDSRNCGERLIYDRTLTLSARRDSPSCERVQEIANGPCEIKLRKRWSCTSLRAPDPLLVWFLSDELFARRWSSVIVGKRYPCDEASLTAEEWELANEGFPTRRQVLADDIFRCGLLEGMSLEEVRAVLGPADEAYSRDGKRYRDYIVGPDRGSVFRVDPEYFSIKFSAGDVYRSSRYYQG